MPANAAAVHISVDPTTFTKGAPLVWKFVPVNVKEVTVADTAVTGAICVTVGGGSVIASTTGTLLVSTAAVYVPPAVAEKQI